MRRLVPLVALGLVLAVPGSALAKPKACRAKVIREALKAAGEDVRAGFGTIRCGDVTNDGARDGIFTVLSGGTAGATHFGVFTGRRDTAGDSTIAYYDSGYKLGVDRVSSRRFDVQQPFYRRDDPNCCPSAFDVTPYRWNGTTFKAGKARRNKKPQQRFFD
jgi:hypothetical protein